MSGDPKTMPLEPCPFCGGLEIKLIEQAHMGYVCCFGCGARGPVKDDHAVDAVMCWNTLHDTVLRRMHHQYQQIESHLGYSAAVIKRKAGPSEPGLDVDTGVFRIPPEAEDE